MLYSITSIMLCYASYVIYVKQRYTASLFVLRFTRMLMIATTKVITQNETHCLAHESLFLIIRWYRCRSLQIPLEIPTVPTFNSCTKYVGRPGKIHDHMPDCYLLSWAWMHEWPTTERNFIRKLRGSLMCFSYFIEMLSIGVCTTRQWQTSDRLVQELNVCTVNAQPTQYLWLQTAVFKVEYF